MQMTFTKLPKSITAEELLSTPLPPVKWIIPGLLPAGLALFAGPSKAGKSWLTLWLCLQIAQGNPVWNREIEPRTVIYFSLEDTFNRLQNRIFQLIDGGDAPERLILQTECPSIGQGLEEQVESLIHTYRDVGLVVIDTLQKVRVSDGNGGMYANDYKEAGALKKLADKYGICILLIHHLRKQTASDPFEQISGSTGLMGVADTSWVMQRKRMSQTADILLTGRDMDDRTLHLREKNCVWTLEDEETAEEREIKTVPDYLWKVAEYIESVGNWQGTASELLAAAGIENAKPNQFTYNMAKYFDKVFEPKNIRYPPNFLRGILWGIPDAPLISVLLLPTGHLTQEAAAPHQPPGTRTYLERHRENPCRTRLCPRSQVSLFAGNRGLPQGLVPAVGNPCRAAGGNR